MFFNNHKTEELGDMFNMARIGANIMKARKAKGLTQMALADELGISFQAVSNWERGQSCPDIAKLGELSRLFEVSIDELLGNERAARITRDLAEDRTPDLKPEELVQVAPLLTEEQADKAAEKTDLDMDALTKLAPYLSAEVLGEALTALYRQTGNFTQTRDLWCYLSEDSGCNLAREVLKTDGLNVLKPMAYYICWDDLQSDLLESIKQGRTRSLTDFAYYMDTDLLGELAMELYKAQGIQAITPLAYYLEEEALGNIVRAAIQTGKLSDLKPLAHYLDTDLGEM